MASALRRALIGVALVLGCLTTGTGTAARRTTVVVSRLDEAQLRELRAVAPEVEIVAVDGAAAARAKIAEADALIGVLDRELVREGKRLRWIQVLSAGVDRYRYPELIDSDITFTNAKIIQGPNVADQAMALLLALTRQVHRAVELSRDRDWRATRRALRDGRTIELHDKVALVVGLGGIGRAIAERARGFGMRVTAVDRTPDDDRPPWLHAVYSPDRLHEALAAADVVILAVPLTDETRSMIDAAAIARMKPGSYIVNIARGKVIDTEALVDALRSGKLAGAGLDVTEPEPLPADHPLWTLDNVVITPHMGGSSDRVGERRMELLKDNLRRFVDGRPLRNVVDKRRGY